MLEKTLTNKIIKSLNNIDGVWVYKRYAPSGNEAGQPDITGIAKGLRVEIEVKAPHRRDVFEEAELSDLIDKNLQIASKRQQYYIKKYKELGAITGVVTGLDQALWLINNKIKG